MRRTWTVGVVASVLVASMGLASPPAMADDCNSGTPFLGASSTIYFENGELKINPNGVGPDVEMVRAWAEGRADDAVECVLSLVPPEVGCLIDKVVEIALSIDPLAPDLRYVYYDQSTGTLAIRYQVLLNDATACSPV